MNTEKPTDSSPQNKIIWLVKNHPFQNGNKRIALTTLLVFLALNGGWLKVKSYDLYKIAIKVAESKPSEKDKILRHVGAFIKINLVPFPV